MSSLSAAGVTDRVCPDPPHREAGGDPRTVHDEVPVTFSDVMPWEWFRERYANEDAFSDSALGVPWDVWR